MIMVEEMVASFSVPNQNKMVTIVFSNYFQQLLSQEHLCKQLNTMMPLWHLPRCLMLVLYLVWPKDGLTVSLDVSNPVAAIPISIKLEQNRQGGNPHHNLMS